MSDTIHAESTAGVLTWIHTTRKPTLAQEVDYHLLRSRSPLGCRDRLIVSLSPFNGGLWQIHRVHPAALPQDGIETSCGVGCTSFWVGETEVPDFELEQICEWCWPSESVRAAVAEYLPKLADFAGLEGLTA